MIALLVLLHPVTFQLNAAQDWIHEEQNQSGKARENDLQKVATSFEDNTDKLQYGRRDDYKKSVADAVYEVIEDENQIDDKRQKKMEPVEDEVFPPEKNIELNTQADSISTISAVYDEPSLDIYIKSDKKIYEPGDIAAFAVTVKNTGNTGIVGTRVYGEDIGIKEKIYFLPAGDTKTIKGKCFIPYGYSDDSFSINVRAEGKYQLKTVKAEDSVILSVYKDIENSCLVEVTTDKIVPYTQDIEKYYQQLRRETAKELAEDEQSKLEEVNLEAAPYKSIYPDTIQVNKTVKPVQGCRTYQVEMSITSDPSRVPLDVILVIDTSRSMAEGSPSSLENAREAAKEFARRILQNNEKNRVAVVSFDFEGKPFLLIPFPPIFDRIGNLYTDTEIEIEFTNDFSEVSRVMDGLRAKGGTNTQAGFIAAKKLMQQKARADAEKVIVMLTDGIPTMSIGASLLFDYGPNEPKVHGMHTIAAYQAGQSCHKIAKVFTVGLFKQVPEESRKVVRETLQMAQNAGYYETFSDEDLLQIYEDIFNKIGKSATEAIVSDTISENFELIPDSFAANPDAQVSYDETTRTITWIPGVIGESARLSYQIKARRDFPGGGAVATSTSAQLIYTDINGNPGLKKEFPAPLVYVPEPLAVKGKNTEIVIGDTVNLGDLIQVRGGFEPCSFEWSCDKCPDWNFTEANPLVSPKENTTYTVKVTDNQGCSKSACVFVRVIKGEIRIEKTVINEDTDTEFVIKIKGPNGKKWNILAREGKTYEIKNLNLGEYEISEVVPMNYEPVSISPSKINITRNQLKVTVKIKNRRINRGWFFDKKEIDNFLPFKVR